jgi:hypothetical protein
MPRAGGRKGLREGAHRASFPCFPEAFSGVHAKTAGLPRPADCVSDEPKACHAVEVREGFSVKIAQ